MKTQFRSKSEKSKREPGLMAAKLHARWKKVFLNAFNTVDEDGVPDYIPHVRERRYAPSRNETQAFKACQKFQDNLGKICGRLYQSVKGKDLAGFNIPKEAKKFQETIANDLAFWGAIRSNVTKGRVRVIRTFMAEPILAGLEIHKSDEVGLELMRQFFEKDGEFNHQIEEWYGDDGKKLVQALCGKQNGRPLKNWVKAFRDLAYKNIILPSDDPKKSNQERSRKGSPKDRRSITVEEKNAKLRSDEIERRIKRLVQSIRRK